MKSEPPFRDMSILPAEGPGLTELQWTAWQYLTDELEPGQAADFEQRLAGDPTAAEALEEMLCLLAELEAAGAEADSRLASIAAPVRRKMNGMAAQQSVRWLAALAAVVLVLLGISRWASTPPKELQPNRVEVSLEMEEVAELWASSFAVDANDSVEDAAEGLQQSEDWLYSALVSLESLENWPSEEQGGS